MGLSMFFSRLGFICVWASSVLPGLFSQIAKPNKNFPELFYRIPKPNKPKATINGGFHEDQCLNLFVFSVWYHIDPVLSIHFYNQCSTTSRSINCFFMISFQFTLFLHLYILTFFLEFKSNPRTSLTSIDGDKTEWEIPYHQRLWWKSHVLPRCHTWSPRNSVAFPFGPFLGGLEPSEEDTYWPWDASHRRTGTWTHQNVVI